VDLLLAAADSVLLRDPRLAARFAGRAARADPTPRADLALSTVYAELGDRTRARAAIETASYKVDGDADRLAVGLEDLSLAMWTERRPATSTAILAALRADVGPAYADTLDSVAALLALFSSRPGDALTAAEAVLARHPRSSDAIRAGTVRLAALTLADRPAEALTASQDLLAAIAAAPVNAYRTGMAHALRGLTRMFCEPGTPDAGSGLAQVPAAPNAAGRWPAGPDAAGGPAWPLLDGVRRHLVGDWAGAATALREAYVQQQHGEGLFRSEAVGGLIVVLAESGRATEAAALLATDPPDDVALIPRLRAWAEAAVAAATGRTTEAARIALAAARDTFAAGATTTALWYLTDAARWGAPQAAAEQLPPTLATPLSQARAAAIRARATNNPAHLQAAAAHHTALGLAGPAAELTALAHTRGARPGLTALTRRESEVAQLAANGLTDKEIADSLVVSVRTVESHLAAAYRKLGITSRRNLPAALAKPSPTTRT
jgi:DNA-binding NarL/FixJ family response regulator